jgi:hypothetical protein
VAILADSPSAFRVPPGEEIRALALDRPGEEVFLRTSDAVYRWSYGDQRPKWRLPLDSPQGFLELSPDGRWLAVGASEGVLLITAREGRVVHCYVAPARCASFSEQGNELALGLSTGVIRVVPLPEAGPSTEDEQAAPDETHEQAAPDETHEQAAPDETHEQAAPDETDEQAAPDETDEQAAER